MPRGVRPESHGKARRNLETLSLEQHRVHVQPVTERSVCRELGIACLHSDLEAGPLRRPTTSTPPKSFTRQLGNLYLPTNTHYHHPDDFYRPTTATRRLLGLGLRLGAASKAPEALGGFGTPTAPESVPRSIRGSAAHGQRRRSRAPRRP
jgi:hypothetical protein